MVIDNDCTRVPREVMSQWALALCNRRFGIGADGLIFLSRLHENNSVRWDFYNNDGSRDTMCGNGARCAGVVVTTPTANYGLDPSKPVNLVTDRGLVTVNVTGGSEKIIAALPATEDLSFDLAKWNDLDVHFLDDGTPHTIVIMNSEEELQNLDINKAALEVRAVLPENRRSTSVNFVAVRSPKLSPEGKYDLALRTFERGCECETLACGTGCAASAFVALSKGCLPGNMVDNAPAKEAVGVKVPSGAIIRVYHTIDTHTLEIEGPAIVSFSGSFTPAMYAL